MINININIDDNFLKVNIESVEGMVIYVGILDKNKKVKIVNW